MAADSNKNLLAGLVALEMAGQLPKGSPERIVRKIEQAEKDGYAGQDIVDFARRLIWQENARPA